MTSDPEAGGPAAHVAERFASDARALRRRAEQLDAANGGPAKGGSAKGRSGAPAQNGARPGQRNAPPGGQGGAKPGVGGPDAAACRRMADACDRVSALVAGAGDAAALGAVVPLLERMLADERTPEVRHVYAGAVERVQQALGEGDDETDDDDEDTDDA